MQTGNTMPPAHRSTTAQLPLPPALMSQRRCGHLRYLLSSNIGEVMTMFFGVLLAPVIGLGGTADAVVLPLLATQLLWINLVTDGAPALALGIDPADPGLMNEPPRSKTEGVITTSMWFGIFVVGGVMALGTLLVLDLSLPGGLISGSGDLRHAQTMAFTTLMLFQLFVKPLWLYIGGRHVAFPRCNPPHPTTARNASVGLRRYDRRPDRK